MITAWPHVATYVNVIPLTALKTVILKFPFSGPITTQNKLV